jgi:hypothetical protein
MRACDPGVTPGSESALRAGSPFVVEVEERVDVGDQRRGLAGTDAEQHLPARGEQLVAKLQGLGKIRLGSAVTHRRDATTP